MLSFVVVLCSQEIRGALPLGAIIVVLLAQQFIGLSFRFSSTGATWMSENRFSPKYFTLTEVQRLLKVRYISRSKINAKLLEAHRLWAPSGHKV